MLHWSLLSTPPLRILPMPTSLDPATERAARAFLEKVAGRYAVTGGIVFGSRARRNHRAGSDADVAVLLRGEPERFAPTMLAMADIAYDVLLDTGIHVQPLPIWEKEWAHPEAYSNPRLLHNIAREGVRL
jgi:predicted nucleotidyltransferase